MKIRSFLNYILVLLVLSGFLNCTKEKSMNKEYQDFPKTSFIKLDSIKIPSVLLKENQICVSQDYLISMSIASDTLFRVFKLPNCEYIGNFGYKGNGPYEFINPNISSFIVEGKGCIVTDLKKVQFIDFKVGQKIDNDNVIFKEHYKIPGALNPLNQVMFLNDSIICRAGSYKSPKELDCFNVRSGNIASLIEYPNIYKNVPDNMLGHLYRKSVAISPDKSKIALLYRHLPLLRIYDTKEHSLMETLINEGPKRIKTISYKGRSVDISKLISYYSDIVVTNEFIYGLFHASKFKVKRNELISIPLTQKQLHVFSWDGTATHKLVLEDWMKVYTVSPDDSDIFFIHPFREDYIYKFNLSEVL